MLCICCGGEADGNYLEFTVCEDCYTSGKLRIFFNTHPEYNVRGNKP